MLVLQSHWKSLRTVRLRTVFDDWVQRRSWFPLYHQLADIYAFVLRMRMPSRLVVETSCYWCRSWTFPYCSWFLFVSADDAEHCRFCLTGHSSSRRRASSSRLTLAADGWRCSAPSMIAVGSHPVAAVDVPSSYHRTLLMDMELRRTAPVTTPRFLDRSDLSVLPSFGLHRRHRSTEVYTVRICSVELRRWRSRTATFFHCISCVVYWLDCIALVVSLHCVSCTFSTA